MENLILCDFLASEEWIFLKELKSITNYEWKTQCCASNYYSKGRRILSYFTFPFTIFKKRKKISNVIAWQQFYGIVLAFYMRLFHVKKECKLTIMTFIYKPKKGFIGNIYLKFLKYAIVNKYVDHIICFSSHECKYYEDIFGRKFEWCRVGIEDQISKFQVANTLPNRGGYLLAVGRSNRDYKFLIDSMKDSEYNLRILCDELSAQKINNISIYDDVCDDTYYEMLSKAYAVIVPLSDKHISSGQLSLLEAMMFGKPIIITKTYGISDYVIDGKNCILIKNDKSDLNNAITKILDDVVYRKLSYNGRRIFLEKYSMSSMAKNIAEIIEI